MKSRLRRMALAGAQPIHSLPCVPPSAALRPPPPLTCPPPPRTCPPPPRTCRPHLPTRAPQPKVPSASGPCSTACQSHPQPVSTAVHPFGMQWRAAPLSPHLHTSSFKACRCGPRPHTRLNTVPRCQGLQVLVSRPQRVPFLSAPSPPTSKRPARALLKPSCI